MLSNRFFQHICVMFKSFQFIAIAYSAARSLSSQLFRCNWYLSSANPPLAVYTLLWGKSLQKLGPGKKNENRSFIILILSQLNKLQKDISARLRSLLKLYFTPLKNKTKGEVIEPRNNCYLIVDTVCPSESLSKFFV